MKTVTVLDGQTILDITIQELGDPDRLMEVAQLNNLEPTDDLVAGSTVNVPDFDLKKRSVVTLFRDNANKPATGIKGGKDEGIDFWKIEVDNIVQ